MAAIQMPEDLNACTPGKLVDKLYALRSRRRVVQQSIDDLKEKENLIIDHLLNRLPKMDLDGCAGKLAKVSITKTMVPHVKDWDALNEYITEHDAWDLRNKAANAKAFRDRWEDGEVIPGVVPFTRVSLSLTQR